MGQGIHTALGAMLAEEMEADWDSMAIMEAPAEKAYANFERGREFVLGGKEVPGMVFGTVNGAFLKISQAMNLQITGGSTSVRFTGRAAMMTAGAAASELLIKAAAKQWGVPESELRAEKSYIYHDEGRSAPFAEFAQTAATLKHNPRPKLKARSNYKLLGKSLPRLDIPSKVDGTAQFGIDATVEGMKYAAIIAAPIHGQQVSRLKADEAKAIETGKLKTLHKVGDIRAANERASASYEAEYRVPF